MHILRMTTAQRARWSFLFNSGRATTLPHAYRWVSLQCYQWHRHDSFVRTGSSWRVAPRRVQTTRLQFVQAQHRSNNGRNRGTLLMRIRRRLPRRVWWPAWRPQWH